MTDLAPAPESAANCGTSIQHIRLRRQCASTLGTLSNLNDRGIARHAVRAVCIRTALLGRTAIAALALLGGASAFAQSYPTRPVEAIVPFPPGGTFDLAARAIQPALSKALGAPVVIINRTGAGGALGTAAAARAGADGYTIAATAGSTLALPPVTLAGGTKYSPDDFVAIGNYATDVSAVLVPANSPFQDFESLVAAARAKPGKLNIGNSGNGGVSALVAAMIAKTLGVNWLDVPFGSSGAVNTALLGGEVDAGVVAMASSVALIESGRLRLLAITGNKPLQRFPSVPMLNTKGIPASALEFKIGFYVPKATPVEVVQRLSDAVKLASGDLATQSTLEKAGLVAAYDAPKDAMQATEEIHRTAKALWSEASSK